MTVLAYRTFAAAGCLAASCFAATAIAGSGTSQSPLIVVDTRDMEIVPQTARWLWDGVQQRQRQKFFHREAVTLPFTLACNYSGSASLEVRISPATNHNQVVATLSGSVHLTPGVRTNEVTWSLPGSPVPAGLYEAAAIVSDGTGVMDTTAPGKTNRVFGATAWLTGAGRQIEVLPRVTIRPNTNLWVNDGHPASPGYRRNQYFAGQRVNLPFEIISETAQNIQLRLIINPVGNREQNPADYSPSPSAMALLSGTNAVNSVAWDPIAAGLPPGFRDARAAVHLAADPTLVLDTTATGENTTNLDTTAWIWANGSGTNIQVCQWNPVVLVHGYSDNATDCWGDMEPLMEQSNNFATVKFDYGPMTGGDNLSDDDQTPIECLAAALAGTNDVIRRPDLGVINNSFRWTNSIAWTKAYFNCARVDIVAHSMGGLLTRAYMAGLATNGNRSVPYQNDIDRIVTLGTPMCGGLDRWTTLNAVLPLHPKPHLQGLQLDWGSRFLWNLHSRAGLYVGQLAIAGSVISFTDFSCGIEATDHDGVVAVGSAACPSLAGSTRILCSYAHNTLFQGEELGQGYYTLASILTADAHEHDAYQLSVETLSRTALSRGVQFSHDNRNRSYVMIDVRGVVGSAVTAAFILVNASGNVVETWLPAGSLEDQIHAYVKELAGTYHLRVIPCGPHGKSYAPTGANITLSGDAPTLLTVQLALAVDNDHDQLPDEWEQQFLDGLDSGPEDDPDHDGYDNSWELTLGTDPNNAASHFGPLGINPIAGAATQAQSPQARSLVTTGWSGSNTVIRVPINAIPGISYELQRSVDLVTTQWVGVASLGPDEIGPVALDDPTPPETNAFYRIRLSIPEVSP